MDYERGPMDEFYGFTVVDKINPKCKFFGYVQVFRFASGFLGLTFGFLCGILWRNVEGKQQRVKKNVAELFGITGIAIWGIV